MTIETSNRPVLFSSADVARKAGVSVDAIRKAEREGRIPEAPRELGGTDRVYTSDLLRVIRSYFASSRV